MIKSGLIFILFLSQILWAQNPPAEPSIPDSSAVNPPMLGPNTEGDNSYDMTPQIDYVYDPTGKKDPFKPYRAPRIRGDNRPSAPQDPLAILEVSQLRLVAVMWNTAKPRAVVTDTQGKNYLLFKNMRIGRNEGVVVDIREGEIVIVEKFDDGFGNTVREARILEIKPSDQPAGG